MIAINSKSTEVLSANSTIFDVDRLALFLDLDGTLAPISRTPDAVGPEPGRNRLLIALRKKLQGRVAVLSGRAIGEVDRILDRSVVAVAGVHGLERRTAGGQCIDGEAHRDLEVARASFEALAKAQRGLLVEDKRLSVALHYRAAVEAGEAVRDLARRLAATTALLLQEGSMVVEMRSPGPDKGDALAAFMDEPPFAGARPVCIGDDLTDENAFAAASLAGGCGVLVGPARETLARWRIESVDEVLGWLASIVADRGVTAEICP